MSLNVQNVDNLDLKIITHLQQDGRKSFRDIAEDVGVTERTVRLRVAQLRECGILQIVGVVNPIKIGLQVVAIIQIDVEESLMDTCIELLRGIPEVRFITRTTGEYPLLIQVVKSSYESLFVFLTEKMKQLPQLRKTNVMVELQVYKNDFHYIGSDGKLLAE
ncbi:Lrp/AsnC family transcriptional regulator (plasmid) [Alicyclobacillus fastidiosus]|uniref:Lrp/AsnC family transcriptional regulator n=1 Tax=Alicyclobacillus fastidiosus TaxID=392011 RepID=A0ABY6ZPQ8_9BACL|nr:Lrp/AsnC family transcriptional regulator [Alicyclobacillus fastidiosus]WAH44845.1 Lrp/AsnC family transcriptional regulator [Alicyclobacillus fastidiosus]GMA65813.1 putative transcriptional regulator, AsnC family protein [Alicyclobacillus fastidiosus]GMA65885.1 putative transcriptional regulator, AsnC family protein [Alicyclobacillus fastidiosus]